MKYVKVFLLSSLLLSFSFYVKGKDKLVAYVEQIPPFIIVEKDKVLGAAVDILDKAISQHDASIEYYEIPWSRALFEAQTKPNIILTGINRLPSREEDFFWLLKLPIKYDGQKVFFWQLKKKQMQFNKVNLKTSRIAIMSGDYKAELFNKYLKNRIEKPNIYTVTSREQAINMLFKKRVDYILGGELDKAWKVKELGYDVNLLERGPMLPNENKGLFIAISKKTDIKLIDQLKNKLRQMETNGELDKIIRSWEENNYQAR